MSHADRRLRTGLVMAMLPDLSAIGCCPGLRTRFRGMVVVERPLPLRNGRVSMATQRHAGDRYFRCRMTCPSRTVLDLGCNDGERGEAHVAGTCAITITLHRAKASQRLQCSNMLQSSESKVRCGKGQNKAATRRWKSPWSTKLRDLVCFRLCRTHFLIES
jgi:hypothetical protein